MDLSFLSQLSPLSGDALAVVSQWKAAGWMAGLAALCALVVKASKLPLVQKWLTTQPAARPWIAAAVGALTALGGALASGASWQQALFAALSGLGAGFAAVGAHQAVSLLSTAGAAESDIKAAIKRMTQAGDADVEAHAAALKSAIDAAAAQPTERERLQALADLARMHPPAVLRSVALLLLPALLLGGPLARADEAAQPAPAAASVAPPRVKVPAADVKPASPAAPPAVAPVGKGEAAPFAGLVVPAETFRAYLDLQVRAEKAEGLLDVRNQVLEETAAELAAARAGNTTWWDKWGSLVTGIAGTVVGVTTAIVPAFAVHPSTGAP